MTQPAGDAAPDLVHPERVIRRNVQPADPAPAAPPDSIGEPAAPVAPDSRGEPDGAIPPDSIGLADPAVAPDSLAGPSSLESGQEAAPAPGERPAATGEADGKPAVPGAAGEGGGLVLVLASALLALLLLAGAGLAGFVAASQVVAPWDLNFESPNLATIRLFQAGVNPYAEGVRDGVPFQWALYTPLYHWLASLLPASDALPFTGGRLLSALAVVLALGAVVLAPATGRGRVTAGALAVVWLLAWPMASTVAYLKNDLLALACAAWAVSLAMLAGRSWPAHPGRARAIMVASGILVVLAFASKQSYLAAGAAIGAWLVAAGPRALLPAWGASAVLGLGAFALAAQVVWGGGFWTSILNTASHPITLAHALFVLGEVAVAPAVGLLALEGLGGLVVLGVRGGGRGLAGSLPAWWFLAAMAVLVITIGKLGSGSNYVYEPLLAAVLLGAAAVDVLPRGRGVVRALLPASLALAVGVALAGALAGWQDTTLLERGAWHLRAGERGGAAQGALPAADTWLVYQGEIGQVLGERRRVPVLNLSTAQYQYAGDARGPFQDQAYLNDVFLYLGLYETGVVDPQPLLEAIAQRRFAVIVRAPVDQVALGRVPALNQAVEEHYRLVRTGGLFDYWVPR